MTGLATGIDTAALTAVLAVVTPFQDIHYGTREMTVRDPDGRLWSLRAPAGRSDVSEADKGSPIR